MSNLLAVLAGEITDAHRRLSACAEQMAEQALELGRKLVLAKAEIPYGQWNAWLQTNTTISHRSASRYMRLVTSGTSSATVAKLGLRAAEEGLARTLQQDAAVGLKLDQELRLWGADGRVAILWRADEDVEGEPGFDFMISGTGPGVWHFNRPAPAKVFFFILDFEGFSDPTPELLTSISATSPRHTLDAWRAEWAPKT